MLLKRRIRERVREIARENYVRQSSRHGLDLLRLRAIEGAKWQLKREFGSSILTSLLISLMVKLAVKYIESWIMNNLYSYNVPQVFKEIKDEIK